MSQDTLQRKREDQARKDRAHNRARMSIMRIANGFTLSDPDGNIHAFTADPSGVMPEPLSAKEKLIDFLDEHLEDMEPGEDEAD